MTMARCVMGGVNSMRVMMTFMKPYKMEVGSPRSLFRTVPYA